MKWTDKPKRLEQIFETHSFPVYFVTAVTAERRPILANATAQKSVIEYATRNVSDGRAMGRFVLMPDHAHFMVRLQAEARLSDYVRLLKQQVTRDLRAARVIDSSDRVWQPGFFDRLLRNSERHSRAWEYMLNNPTEAGLARVPGDWPFQGEIEAIRF